MRTTLQPILDLLDEGLRLYRREFARFALITAIGAIPMGLLGALVMMIPWMLGSFMGVLLFYGLLFLTFPFAVYLMSAMSRATLEVRQGKPIILREVLRIGPFRLIGMGCYGGFYLAALNTIISIFSVFCMCPTYAFLGLAAAGVGGMFGGSGAIGSALSSLIFTFLSFLFILLYGLSLVLSGATFGSLLFSLQPFMHGNVRMIEALRQSIDITFYRFGSNLLIYLCASLIFGTLALCVTLAVGVLIPMPLLFLFGAESVFAQTLSAVVVIFALTLALPPLPIWMALLFQRRVAEREGLDLAERIAGVVG